MSHGKSGNEPGEPHYEGAALIIEGRVKELEREQNEYRKRDEEYKRLQVIYNRRLAWFTGGLLITSIVANLIYLDMSSAARKTAKAAQDAITQSKLNNDAAIAAQERIAQQSLATSQQLAQQSLKATIDAFQLEQRAWVGPSGEINLQDMQAPSPIKAAVGITNSGKTAAFQVNFRYFMHASDEAINAEQYARHPVEPAVGPKAVTAILPNAHMELVPQTGSTDALGIESVKNGRKLLYLFVFVTYSDVFDHPHETRFCAEYFAANKHFGSCPGSFDRAD